MRSGAEAPKASAPVRRHSVSERVRCPRVKRYRLVRLRRQVRLRKRTEIAIQTEAAHRAGQMVVSDHEVIPGEHTPEEVTSFASEQFVLTARGVDQGSGWQIEFQIMAWKSEVRTAAGLQHGQRLCVPGDLRREYPD